VLLALSLSLQGHPQGLGQPQPLTGAKPFQVL